MWGESGDASDSELTAATRAGDAEAFNTLFRRHFAAACRFAGRFTSPDDVQDRVIEGFTRVYQQLRRGKGPDSNFRAYLYTAIRNAQTDALRRQGLTEVPLDDLNRDEASDDNVEEEAISRVADDTPIMRAFGALQPTWQRVLWHTIVLGETNNEVAASIGSNPNAVAVLAFRAREGLRQAYLAEHVKTSPGRECERAAQYLPRFVRGQLSAKHSQSVEAHLQSCVHCRNGVADLGKINQNLAALLTPVLILAGPSVVGGSVALQATSGSHATLTTKVALAVAGGAAAVTAIVALYPESTEPSPSPTAAPTTASSTEAPRPRTSATPRPRQPQPSRGVSSAAPTALRPTDPTAAPSRTPQADPPPSPTRSPTSSLSAPRVSVAGSSQVRQAQVSVDVTRADQKGVEVRVTNAESLSVDSGSGISCAPVALEATTTVATCDFDPGAPQSFTITFRVTFKDPSAEISGSVVLKPDNRAVSFTSA